MRSLIPAAPVVAGVVLLAATGTERSRPAINPGPRRPGAGHGRTGATSAPSGRIRRVVIGSPGVGKPMTTRSAQQQVKDP